MSSSVVAPVVEDDELETRLDLANPGMIPSGNLFTGQPLLHPLFD
jgi:hypothetical protein